MTDQGPAAGTTPTRQSTVADHVPATGGRRLHAPLAKALPPAGLARVIAFQSALSAIGVGAFLTGGIVFFTQVLRLTPLQIGAGFSIVGFTGLAAYLPLGALADRVGGKRAWSLGTLIGAAGFVAYPLARSFPAFIALMIVIGAADSFANSGRVVYTADAIPADGRVRAMAFTRVYFNVGLTLGTGLGSVALAVGSPAALIVLVGLNAAILLVNAVSVARLPAARAAPQVKVKRSHLAVLRDGPYVALSVLVAVMMFHAVVFVEVIPLWAITHTDLPKPVLGWLFALNTALAVALQVPASRGANSLPGAGRVLRQGALATAIACPVVAFSGMTRGVWTIAVLTVAVLLTTATELRLSAAQWYFQTDVPPPERRGAYVGLAGMISSIGGMVSPAGLTLLAIQTGGWGWWVIAALFAACAVAAGPAAGWAARTPRAGEPTPIHVDLSTP